MSEATFEAPTVEAALEQAAAALGVAANELEHEVVETKRDFWGSGDDTLVIKAWKRVEETPAPEPQPESACPMGRGSPPRWSRTDFPTCHTTFADSSF